MAPSITFVLVEPQLPENIGAVARAMLNFGLTALRLVNPRCDVANPDVLSKIRAMSAGADAVVDHLTVFETVDEALADQEWVYGTCAAQRHMIKRYTPARVAAAQIHTHPGNVAILFGPERTGLHNNDQVRCREIIQIPVNPDFSSMNLAAAAGCLAYDLYSAEQPVLAGPALHYGATRPATAAQLGFFLKDLERQLEDVQFWRVPHKKEKMWQNIQNIFTRLDLTEQEVRTLQGMIRHLYEFP